MRSRRDRKVLSLSLIASFAATFVGCISARALDPLEAGFRVPPNAARPRVWWHWMDGNVAQEGVRADLEWMKRVGIGGVTNIDAAFEWGSDFDTPQAAHRIAYLTPEWRQIFRYSVALAGDLGFEFTVASSPGYSETGGPWVRPDQAMKKLVWSETNVRGGEPFKGRLAQPPRTAGPFQNIPAAKWGRIRYGDSEDLSFYADVATVAYPAPLAQDPLPTVSSSSGTIDGARLSDGDLASVQSLPFGSGPYAWIEFSFIKPQRIQSITSVFARPLSWDPLQEPSVAGWVEAGDEEGRLSKIVDLPRAATHQSSSLEQTVAFSPVVARVFRVVLERPDSTPGLAEQLGLTPPPVAHQIAELVLHASPRVNRFEDKAGYSTRQILEVDDTPAVTAADVVDRSDVLDLTSRMSPDGSLNWTPPPGRWIVLRFGYSLTGRTNFPASQAGTGLEVDKLNRVHTKAYIDAYLGEYRKTLGRGLMGRRGLNYILFDSYEAGPQNWTDDLLDQFRRRRGYDALPWLPVLAGRVEESATSSDRFLWDFRRTIGELIADAHYGQLSASLHEHGLRRYGESHEHLRAFLGDGIVVKKTADIPMGAILAASPSDLTRDGYDADLRESASVGHIYGKQIVAAESFTAWGDTYGFAPETLKPIADRGMAMGLNRFVIANSVHQPDSKPGPGIGLGPFGQWFTRKETWAKQAGSWVSYLARSSYLLQQGRFVADIAYLYGEDTNVTSVFDKSQVPIPSGYGFDFVNADVVLSDLSVNGNTLETPGGMKYRLLVLDPSTHRISVPVLRKISGLVRAGAIVTGGRPTGTPSLADDEGEFRSLVAELWGDAPGERAVGAGKVFGDRPLAEVLASMHISPDASFTNSDDAQLRFVHRELPQGDIYFVSNGSPSAQTVEASFRVTGKLPQVWRADTATIAPLSYRMENERTIVPLRFGPNDAVFVIFRMATNVRSAVIPDVASELLATVVGPWDIQFPPDLGAPAHARFQTLYSWTDSADAGVKYFSGTATYERTLPVARGWLKKGAHIVLDLGKVKNVAEVLVNGHSAGVVWKAPFRLDVTKGLHAGENRLQIKVTNLWPNRLIGDRQPGARKIAYAAYDPFKPDSPLLPSGLLGPVTLSRQKN
jgi:hypothetical protein